MRAALPARSPTVASNCASATFSGRARSVSTPPLSLVRVDGFGSWRGPISCPSPGPSPYFLFLGGGFPPPSAPPPPAWGGGKLEGTFGRVKVTILPDRDVKELQ